MGILTLTDAELARLEELAGKANEGPFRPDGNNQVFRGDSEPFAFAYAVGFPTDDNQPANCEYIAAACNAAPALVAEVRRLRAALNKEHRAWQCAEMRGDVLEAENAALRDRVEALEWLVECIDNYEWNSNRSGWFVAQGVAKEAKATMQAAREAMK